MKTAQNKALGKSDFREIYRRFASMVRAVGFRMAGADGIDDLVQESFLRIWRGLEKYDGRSSMKTWIYRIAVNTAIDHMRKRGRNPLRLVTEDTAALQAPKDSSLATRDLIEKAFAALTDDYRVVLVLSTFEGLPIKEIAEVVDAPEGTVKSRIKRARDQVRKFLEDHGVEI